MLQIRLIHRSELMPYELPYIEQNQSAWSRLRSQFVYRHDWDNIVDIDRIIREYIICGRWHFQGYRHYIEGREKEYLWSRLEEMILDGDIFLVHFRWDPYFRPALYWFKDERSPSGRWPEPDFACKSSTLYSIVRKRTKRVLP